MGELFNNGSMTTKWHILNKQEGLGDMQKMGVMRNLGTEKPTGMY